MDINDSWDDEEDLAQFSRFEPEPQSVSKKPDELTQLRARIAELEQLAKEMAGDIASFGHKPGCRKNAFGDECTCGIDKALSRYREVIGEVK